MRKFIKINEITPKYVSGVVRFDNGVTMNVTLSRNEYDVEEAERKIMEIVGDKVWEKITPLIDDIKENQYEIGYDSGYDSGYDYGENY